MFTSSVCFNNEMVHVSRNGPCSEGAHGHEPSPALTRKQKYVNATGTFHFDFVFVTFTSA